MASKAIALIVTVLFTFPSFAAEFDHNYSTYNQILSQAVIPSSDGTKTKVDYKKINSENLDNAIDQLLAVTKDDVFSKFSYEQRLAYFINLYNAVTLRLIKKKFQRNFSSRKSCL